MKLNSFGSLQSTKSKFYGCFPPDSIENGIRKVKKKKEHKNKKEIVQLRKEKIRFLINYKLCLLIEKVQ